MKISEIDKWTFYYSDVVPTAIPVTVKELSSTEILFHFPYGKESGKISLTLSTGSRGSFQGS